jgi:hypothetical protein
MSNTTGTRTSDTYTATYRPARNDYVIADGTGREVARLVPELTANGPAARLLLTGRFDADAERWVPRSIYAAGLDAVTAWAFGIVARHAA